MRPGPSIEALSQGVAIAARIDSYRGRTPLALDIPSREVMWEWTRERVVPSQVTFTAPLEWVPTGPESALSNHGQRLWVRQIIDVGKERHEVEIGWFQVHSWDEESSGVRVTALDLMQVAEEDPAAWPSSPPRGASLRSELLRLAKIPVKLDGFLDFPIPREYEWGHSRTEAVRDLCTSWSLDYAIKSDGYLHVWNNETRTPVGHYTGRDLLMDAPKSSRERRPNRFVVVGEGQEQRGWDSETLIDKNDPSTSGWSGRGVTAEWTFPNGRSGDCARVTWRVRRGEMTGPRIQFTKSLQAEGRKQVSLWVRASKSSPVRVAVMGGATTHASETVTASSWSQITLTVPSGKRGTHIVVSQEGAVSDGQWIELDTFTYRREWTVQTSNKVNGRVVKRRETKTETVSTNFNDHTRKGWAASSAVAKFSSEEGGKTADMLRISWGNLHAGSTGNFTARWEPSEGLTGPGKKSVSMWIRSKKDNPITIRLVAGGDTRESVTVSATVWKKVSLTVLDGYSVEALEISQPGTHHTVHTIDIDELEFVHETPHMVDRRFTTSVQTKGYPLDPERYGWVTHRVELSGASTQAQVRDAAEKIQRTYGIARETRSLEIVPDSRLEGGDFLSVTTDVGEKLVGQIVAVSLPISEPNALMRVDMEVHQW